MEAKLYSRIKEERLIERFQKEFFQKTGKHLRIEDYEPELPFPIVNLYDLEDICNQFIPVGYPNIRVEIRRKEVVYPRMLFCNMAYSMGYSIRQIASHVERDRSTVYNAVSTYDNLMETRDAYCTELYNEVVNKLNNLYNGTTIPTLSDPSDHPEPVVSAVLF